jgi:hypothetical protein
MNPAENEHSPLDSIMVSFKQFCETGDATNLSETDVDYIAHALRKASRNAAGNGEEGVAIFDHQLFVLMALEGGIEKVVPYLEFVAKKKGLI